MKENFTLYKQKFTQSFFYKRLGLITSALFLQSCSLFGFETQPLDSNPLGSIFEGLTGEIQVIGIYETDNAVHGSEGAPMGNASVHIERQGAQVLVLNAFRQTHWTVTVDPGVDLQRVIAFAPFIQKVDAPEGVQVDILDFTVSGLSLECSTAFPSNKDTGCNTKKLLGQVECLTELPIFSFHGCYEGNSFIIHDNLDVSATCNEEFGYSLSGFSDPTGRSFAGKDCNELFFDATGTGCEGREGFGKYEGFFCFDEASGIAESNPHNFIITKDISCQYALENCELNSSLNPGVAVYCDWNGQRIFENEGVEPLCPF